MELIRSGTTEYVVASFFDEVGDPVTGIAADIELYLYDISENVWYNGSSWTATYAAVSGATWTEAGANSGVYRTAINFASLFPAYFDYTVIQEKKVLLRVIGPPSAGIQNRTQDTEITLGGLADILVLLRAALLNKVTLSTTGLLTLYDDTGTTAILQIQCQNAASENTSTNVHQRNAPTTPA